MTRRTVDITVDAYDAPSLIAVARERERQRELGHADGAIPRLVHDHDLSLCGLDDLRLINDDGQVNEEASCESLLREEFEEALYELRGADFGPLWIQEFEERAEARVQHRRDAVIELRQLAALALRIASAIEGGA